MARVSKRLNILVTDPTMLEWPEIKKLAEQGHDINTHVLEPRLAAPVIYFYLGPTAWRMNSKLKRYLPLAIKEMRRLAYPKEVDPDDTGSDTGSSDEAGDDAT
jgi:hypothetical protein